MVNRWLTFQKPVITGQASIRRSRLPVQYLRDRARFVDIAVPTARKRRGIEKPSVQLAMPIVPIN
jgi:hypothetical protein